MEDGAILYDGGQDPASGDLLKIHFRSNCTCYVYVLGVDATGYVAQIFPDEAENHRNPVRANEPRLIPAAGDDWWALDTFKGVEQVYFLASKERRRDVEQILATMAGMPRTAQAETYRPVAEAVVLPRTRGLVKVKAKPVRVTTGSSSQSFTPTLFSPAESGAEVVVTRWFRHQ